MTSSIPPARRIQLLLTTLLGERHVRRALLLELLDELVMAGRQDELLEAVRTLMRELANGIREAEYEGRIQMFIREESGRHSPAAHSHAAE